MRWIENKSFQHPVLMESVPAELRDYVAKSFQATTEFKLDNPESPELQISFALSEHSLKQLVEAGKANYAAEIYCPSTFLRRLRSTSRSSLACSFSKGELHERVEISSYVVCVKDISGHRSENLHHEFGKNAAFDLKKGDVLAVGKPQEYWWDLDFLKSISSIFVLEERSSVDPGLFELGFDSEKVRIMMHRKDIANFNAMREQALFRPFLLASVYLNALAETLRIMSSDEADIHGSRKWYRAVQYKLDQENLELDENSSCSEFAQRLLELPLAKMLSTSKEVR